MYQEVLKNAWSSTSCSVSVVIVVQAVNLTGDFGIVGGYVACSLLEKKWALCILSLLYVWGKWQWYT